MGKAVKERPIWNASLANGCHTDDLQFLFFSIILFCCICCGRDHGDAVIFKSFPGEHLLVGLQTHQAKISPNIWHYLIIYAERSFSLLCYMSHCEMCDLEILCPWSNLPEQVVQQVCIFPICNWWQKNWLQATWMYGRGSCRTSLWNYSHALSLSNSYLILSCPWK